MAHTPLSEFKVGDIIYLRMRRLPAHNDCYLIIGVLHDFQRPTEWDLDVLKLSNLMSIKLHNQNPSWWASVIDETTPLI